MNMPTNTPEVKRAIALCKMSNAPSRELDVTLALLLDPHVKWSPLTEPEWRDLPKVARGDSIPRFARPFTSSFDEALLLLPVGWWLVSVGEDRTPITYRDDRHKSLGTWTAKVQHRQGGLLQVAKGRQPALAVCTAAVLAMDAQADAIRRNVLKTEQAA